MSKASLGKQISVFVENQPGTLASVAEFLGSKGINIYALTLTGGIEHGYVRMVVNRHDEAAVALREAGYLLFERDVVLLEVSNAPGSLGRILQAWADVDVNVEYGYCAGGPSVECGMVVLMVDDAEKACRVLD